MNIGTMIKRLQDIMRQDAGVNGDAQRIEQIVWMLFLKLYDAKESEWEILEDNYKSIIPELYRWRNWALDNKDGKAMTGDELSNFIINLFNALKELEINETTPIRGRIVREVFEDLNNYMKDGILIRQVVNVLNEIDLTDFQTRHAFNEIYETILKDLQSAGKSGEFYTPRAVTDFVVKMVNPQIGETVADFACGTGGFLVSALNHMKENADDTSANEELKKSFYGVEKKSLPYLLCTTNLLLHDINEPNIVRGNSLEKNVRDYEENEKFDIILMNPPYGGTEKKSVQQNFPAELRDSETADLFMVEILYRLKENGKVGIVLPDGFLFGTDNTKVAIKKKLMEECNLHTIIRLPGSIFAPYTSIATNLLFFDKTGPTKEIWFYRMDLPDGYKAFSKTKSVELVHMKPISEWWNNREEIKDEQTETWKAKKYTIKEINKVNYNLDFCGFPLKSEKILSPQETIKKYLESKEILQKELMISTKKLKEFFNNNYVELGNIKDISDKLINLEMNFPNDMRKAVLQSAVSGKLTKQNSNENIEGIIRSIETKINKKIETVIDYPFEIPQNWKWIKFGELVSFNIGKTPPRADSKYWSDGGYNWISISDMVEDGLVKNTKECVSEIAKNEIFKNKISKVGTLIMSFKLTVGRCSILDIDSYHNEGIISIYPNYDSDVIKKYLFKILPFITKYGDTKGAIKGNTLNSKSLSKLLIPLPPIEEQQRIVDMLEKILPVLRK